MKRIMAPLLFTLVMGTTNYCAPEDSQPKVITEPPKSGLVEIVEGTSENKVDIYGEEIQVKPEIKLKSNQWNSLDEGLEIGQFLTKKKSILGDSKITILKINLQKYQLELYCADENNESPKTVESWAEDKNLIAVINPGMFHSEGTSVGYMKHGHYINNPNLKQNYRTLLAFNSKDPKQVTAQIIDYDANDPKIFEEINQRYGTMIQSIRMLGKNQKNVWSKQNRMWSQAALGITKSGEILFIHSRSPYNVHDFIDEVKRIPEIDIDKMMYLEGGPEASLYVNTNNFQFNGIGSYETGFNENDSNLHFWNLPNVLGIKKKNKNN